MNPLNVFKQLLQGAMNTYRSDDNNCNISCSRTSQHHQDEVSAMTLTPQHVQCVVKMELLSYIFLSAGSPMLIIRAFENAKLWPSSKFPHSAALIPRTSADDNSSQLEPNNNVMLLPLKEDQRDYQPAQSRNVFTTAGKEYFNLKDRVVVNLTKQLLGKEIRPIFIPFFHIVLTS